MRAEAGHARARRSRRLRHPARLPDWHHARPDLASEIVDALARHISESLDNISVPLGEETGSFDFAALAFTKIKRTKPNQILPGW
ncbi:hypothetical protein AJ88_12280 [Mesorhizobium amorphae CCBAU 01583]|nr:hypothetical protein AJ88_12280 [Mesorhizobium amorphae CCBAU 01583]